MIRVLLVDDHRIVREGVRRLLAETSDIRVVAEAVTGAEAMAVLSRGDVDVVVLDVSLPGSSFVRVLSELRARFPAVKVVVLSARSESEYAVQAIRGGASGYVAKERSPDELVTAIRTAAAGRRYVTGEVGELLAAEASERRPAAGVLSDREREVLRLLGAGRSVKEIGALLGVSVKTVSTYRSRLLRKLGLGTTAELIRYSIENEIR